jgi:hypothetical protein
LIASDPTVRMYFTQMIDQVPGYFKHTNRLRISWTLAA